MAAETTQKRQNFATRVTDAINHFADARDVLVDLTGEYNALDYGNPETGITDEVLANSSCNHLDRPAFLAGFTSIAAVEQLWAAGHGTNFARFRR